MYRVLCLLMIAAGSVEAAATDDPVLENGERIAEASALGALGCPFEGSFAIPAYFHQQRDGAEYEAHAALLLPRPLTEVADTILDLERYPEWALASVDGQQRLEQPRVHRDEGRAEIQLNGISGPPLQAQIEQGRGPTEAWISFEPTESDDLEGMRLEATARPAPGCEGATLVTLRLSWEVGWVGRLIVGDVTRSPALFLLKLRGDLIAEALDTTEIRASLLAEKGEFEDGRWHYMSPPDGWDRTFLGRIYPAWVELPAGRAEQVLPLRAKVRRGSRKFGDHLELLLESLKGSHLITGYRVAITAGDRRGFTRVGDNSTMGYSVFLLIERNRAGLGLSASFEEDSER